MGSLSAKGRQISTRIPNEMNKEENEWETKKKCGICQQQDHNKNNYTYIPTSSTFPQTNIIVYVFYL